MLFFKGLSYLYEGVSIMKQVMSKILDVYENTYCTHGGQHATKARSSIENFGLFVPLFFGLFAINVTV